MKLTLIALIAVAAGLIGLTTARPAQPTAAPAVHCQVPCGIFTDKMRIDMLMEDCTTIEKAMGQIAIEPKDAEARQKMVRWIITKEEHAQNIQDKVAGYWLAQRIKQPKDLKDTAAMAKYHKQLVVLHGMTVQAMKCKQSLDSMHVDVLRALAKELSETYFSAEDLEHLKGHHWK